MKELAPQTKDGSYSRPTYNLKGVIGSSEFPVCSSMKLHTPISTIPRKIMYIACLPCRTSQLQLSQLNVCVLHSRGLLRICSAFCLPALMQAGSQHSAS